MKRREVKKRFLRPIHLYTILFLGIYAVSAKIIYFSALYHTNFFTTYLYPYLFGITTTSMFLYLFSHEDFFSFIREVEKKEEKKEKGYLKKFLRFGKIMASILIGIIGGPIFLALTISILLKNFTYKYWLILGTMLLSVLISVGLVKSLISFFI